MLEKILICTDLDRTLIPNGDVPESPEARKSFRKLVSDSRVTLAYVTGRDQKLVKEAILKYQLPVPNFVVADVGASIFNCSNNQEWLRLKNWDQKIGRDWQNKIQSELRAILPELPECKLQEDAKQGRYKLSFYVYNYDKAEYLKSQISTLLDKYNFKSNLIWSIDEKAGVGLLDILPMSANKYYAIKYLMESNDFTLKNAVFSGDSGNDLDVLTSPINAVLVKNAHRELKEQITRMKSSNSIYIAQGGYLEMNGNYSGGILEGIAHYFPEISSWLT